MRPKKRILIACDDENHTSELRFLLHTKGYAVFAAESAEDAVAELAAASFEAVAIRWPLAGAADLVEAALDAFTPSLVIAPREKRRPETLADAVLWGPTPTADLLDRVKAVCARKRGPRSPKKPAASVFVGAGLRAAGF